MMNTSCRRAKINVVSLAATQLHKVQTVQKSTPKHKTNRTTTEDHLGTISNIKLLWGGGVGWRGRGLKRYK